jgi:hypothetical protein
LYCLLFLPHLRLWCEFLSPSVMRNWGSVTLHQWPLLSLRLRLHLLLLLRLLLKRRLLHLKRHFLSRLRRLRRPPGEWWKVREPTPAVPSDDEDDDEDEGAGWVTIEFAGLVSGDPRNWVHAMSGPNADKWRKAAIEEIQTLLANGTWTTTDLPPGVKVLPCVLKQRTEVQQ